MTYIELKTAVEDYCENTFSDADFATMTIVAEQKIYNSAQFSTNRKTANVPLATGDEYVNAPTDLISVFNVAVTSPDTTVTYLLNKDVNFIREAYPKPSSSNTVPKYYAIYGQNILTTTPSIKFIIGPNFTMTTGAYNLTVDYYAYPTSITTAGTTWLGDNFGFVLFNAVMVEAIRFMKGEVDMVEMYADQYRQSLLLLKNTIDGKQRQDNYRVGQVRTQVI
jgi:hypothetical protein